MFGKQQTVITKLRTKIKGKKRIVIETMTFKNKIAHNIIPVRAFIGCAPKQVILCKI